MLKMMFLIVEMINEQKLINEYKSNLDKLKREIVEYDKDNINSKINEVQNEILKIEDEIKRSENRINVLDDFEKKYNEEYQKLKQEKKDFADIGNNSSKKEKIFEKKIQESKKII